MPGVKPDSAGGERQNTPRSAKACGASTPGSQTHRQPDTQTPPALQGHLGGSEQLGEQGVGTPSPAMRGHGAAPQEPPEPPAPRALPL